MSLGWVLVLLTMVIGSSAFAQNAASPTSLQYWIENGLVTPTQIQEREFNQTTNQTLEWDISDTGPVTTLAITGTVEFYRSDSLVRVILVDDQLNEKLVYEAYPLLTSANTIEFENICRETCVHEPVTPRTLRVEIAGAFINVKKIAIVSSNTDSARTQTIEENEVADRVRALQNAEIINQLNVRIQQLGLRWTAGETEFSHLSYTDKKRLFRRGESPELPNLQGFEYYVGGIYEIESDNGSSSNLREDGANLVDSFNWRSRHGADNPDSPYYDNDPNKSGWITSIKRQLCNDCWAQCAVGAVEAQANLYFNQHLNLDLSEQQIISCANAGSCADGGFAGGALRFIRDEGVVDDACYQQTGTDSPCSDTCPVPTERMRIGDYHYLSQSIDGEIKRELIEYGPITFGIVSWWHCMLLVGYETDENGDTVWLVKNSWGDSWGEDGYGKLVVPLDDRYILYAVEDPVYSDITNYEVACYDHDGDGYANWGIGAEKPLSCPESANEPDCDDFDSSLGTFEINGSCKIINDSISPPTGLREDIYSSTAVELFWDRSPTPLSYEILRNGVVVAQTAGVSYFDDTLVGNTRYDYEVIAVNNRGQRSAPALLSIGTLVEGVASPGSPTNASLVSYSDTAAELFWDRAPSDDNVVSTVVRRNGIVIGQAEGNSYFDDTRDRGETYQYELIAVNVIGLRSEATMVGAEVDPITGPSAPQSFSGEVYSSTALELFWSTSSEDESIAGYDIYRGEELIAETLNALSFYDSSLSPGTLYRYRIIAVDRQGNRSAPASIELTTFPES